MVLGLLHSTPHLSVPPEALGTSISIQLCGLVQPKLTTVPVSWTVLSRSNMAPEWCAKAGALKTRISIALSRAAQKVATTKRACWKTDLPTTEEDILSPLSFPAATP